MFIFSLGTAVGTACFMLMSGDEAPSILTMPPGAKIVQSNDHEVWFDASGQTLASIARLNHMTPQGRVYTAVGQFTITTLDRRDGHFHAIERMQMSPPPEEDWTH